MLVHKPLLVAQVNHKAVTFKVSRIDYNLMSIFNENPGKIREAACNRTKWEK